MCVYRIYKEEERGPIAGLSLSKEPVGRLMEVLSLCWMGRCSSLSASCLQKLSLGRTECLLGP